MTASSIASQGELESMIGGIFEAEFLNNLSFTGMEMMWLNYAMEYKLVTVTLH